MRWRVRSSQDPSSGQMMAPGATPFTRTSGPSSSASERVRPARPALAIEYTTKSFSGRSAWMSTTFTIAPRAFLRCGAAAWARNSGARRLVPMRSSQAASVDRTRIVRPVAPLLDIARTCRGTAEVALLLHVGRAGQAGAVAGLGDVTDAAGSPAHRARGLETVGRTGVVRAVAALLGVARAGGGPA